MSGCKSSGTCISSSIVMSEGAVESNGRVQWTIEDAPQAKPWQLSASVMAANGSSQKAIARLHGVEPSTVSTLYRQPWFARRVTEIMAANQRSINELFKSEAIASLGTLLELRDTAQSEAVRIRAAEIILERTLGKPGVQTPEDPYASFVGDPVEEAARIQAELDRSYEERHRFDRK